MFRHKSLPFCYHDISSYNSDLFIQSSHVTSPSSDNVWPLSFECPVYIPCPGLRFSFTSLSWSNNLWSSWYAWSPISKVKTWLLRCWVFFHISLLVIPVPIPFHLFISLNAGSRSKELYIQAIAFHYIHSSRFTPSKLCPPLIHPLIAPSVAFISKSFIICLHQTAHCQALLLKSCDLTFISVLWISHRARTQAILQPLLSTFTPSLRQW